MDFTLKTSFTMCISGPTGSGKTSWIENLLKQAHNIYDKPPGKVLYCYKVYQDRFNDMNDIVDEYHKGIPSVEKLEEFCLESHNATIIIDDLAEAVTKEFTEFFTVFSHHYFCNSSNSFTILP